MRTGPWGLFQLAGRHGKQAANTGTQYKDPEPVPATVTVPYTGWLTLISQFWRVEVEDQGTSMVQLW